MSPQSPVSGAKESDFRVIDPKLSGEPRTAFSELSAARCYRRDDTKTSPIDRDISGADLLDNGTLLSADKAAVWRVNVRRRSVAAGTPRSAIQDADDAST